MGNFRPKIAFVILLCLEKCPEAFPGATGNSRDARASCDLNNLRFQQILSSNPYNDFPDEEFIPRISPFLMNWMSRLPDHLSLSQMSIPCTHDSGTRSVPATRWAQTQSLSISTQLMAGIRGLDIRCRHLMDQFLVFHGPIHTGLTFDEIMKEVQQFLAIFPSELVLLRIKEEFIGWGNSRDFSQTLRAYIQTYPNLIWRSMYLPSLGEARSKVILLDEGPEETPRVGIPWTDFEIQDDFQLPSIFWLHESRIKWKWQRVKRFFYMANKGDPARVHINFLSGFHKYTVPWILAQGQSHCRGINERAKDLLVSHDLKLFRLGWVFMDFPEMSLIYAIVIRNYWWSHTCNFTNRATMSSENLTFYNFTTC